MSKKKQDSPSIATRNINVVFSVTAQNNAQISFPYIREATIERQLRADVANSEFTIVMPQMSLDLEWVMFTITGNSGTYITSERVDYEPEKETEERIAGDRIIKEFRAGDTVMILVLDSSGGLLTSSFEITII